MNQKEKTEMTKERILQAAIKEFGKNGYEACTINSISKDYNISKGLIYYNYSGKDDLYLSCIERCFLDVTEYLKNQDIEDDLEKYMKVRFHYFSENPLYSRIFFEAILQPIPHMREKITEIKADFNKFNRELFRSALNNIDLREGITEEDAVQYYEIMQEMFNGYFSSPSYAGKEFDFLVNEHEGKLSKMIDLMLFGIGEKRKEVENV